MTAYSLLREKIIDVLDTLTERERRVLSLRFGLVELATAARSRKSASNSR